MFGSLRGMMMLSIKPVLACDASACSFTGPAGTAVMTALKPSWLAGRGLQQFDNARISTKA
jgi:hypothetical protein